eukprot:Phypoly_transcript_31334.p1 GENE.Phypoly_transcript_31334~~Phypoly_transcript_31334.p1  ORF type:complete len:114 (+),score=17.36 Phypoly_transcript_31334:47-388(+)
MILMRSLHHLVRLQWDTIHMRPNNKRKKNVCFKQEPQHATRNTQHATRNTQHTTRNTQHATRNDTQHSRSTNELPTATLAYKLINELVMPIALNATHLPINVQCVSPQNTRKT